MTNINSKYIYILREIIKDPYISQRNLASKLSYSIGKINLLIKELIYNNYLESTKPYVLTDKARNFLQQYKVDKAIILAAGFGSRFVPLTYYKPKGLLNVLGEPMIERQIKQLHEVGIYDITIIVGYLKEHFEYLIDKFNVKLFYNKEYKTKNTLATLYNSRNILIDSNTYILSSDNWIRHNIYNMYEEHSWYSCVYADGPTKEWCVSLDKNEAIIDASICGKNSYFMYGPVYITKEFANKFIPYIEQYYNSNNTDEYYWEDVLLLCLRDKNITLPPIYINKQSYDNVFEFENIDELRLFDTSYNNINNNEAMNIISTVFNINQNKITNFACLKSGMTNKSFIFSVDMNKYICRIPGEGTDKLINRKNEATVYECIKKLDICEHLIYLDSATGYKISVFYDDAKNADFSNKEELNLCLSMLRKLHNSNIKVDFNFDILKEINFYEKLCLDLSHIPFLDYDDIKQQARELYDNLQLLNRDKTLCHIDSVCDNFLVLNNNTVKLIDWEYAAMADPLIDISMCAIYSYFDKKDADNLIYNYLQRTPTNIELKVYYSYMALGGLLWSLWGVYKSLLNEDFGDYTLTMYRYAKDYINYVNKL